MLETTPPATATFSQRPRAPNPGGAGVACTVRIVADAIRRQPRPGPQRPYAAPLTGCFRFPNGQAVSAAPHTLDHDRARQEVALMPKAMRKSRPGLHIE